MAILAVIFDMDGTLVDTNAVHVEAWRRAFDRLGYKVAEDRIMREVGKGGDKLVPSILDDTAEAEHGEELRKCYGEEFLKIAGEQTFRLFPQVRQLMAALNRKGIRTAIATSAEKNYLDAIQKSAACDLAAVVDNVVTASDAENSKPEPDIVTAAVAQLGVSADECVMVGDTPHDGEACRRAGVAFVGLTSGGHSEETLRDAGAVAVWSDTGTMLAELDRLLQLEVSTAA
jgi:HAD superfamily hydrolase (TIGR01509 family)